MNKEKTHSYQLIAFFLIILLVSGCSLKPSPTFIAKPETSLISPNSPTFDQRFSTNKPTASFTPNKASTSLSLILSSTPSVTPIRSIPPTPKSEPTIKSEFRQNFLIDLYKTNGGCKLPCWWGFTLGDTQWSEVEALFKRLDVSLTLYQGIYSIQHKFKDTGLQLAEDLAVVNGHIDSIVFGGSIIHNNEIVLGDSYYNQVFATYQLSAILVQYGLPDDIWVRTFPGAPEGGDIPFYIILGYNQLGIWVKYSGNVENLGSEYRICPQKVNVDLLLWSPVQSDQETLQRMRDVYFVSNLDFQGYKSLKAEFNLDQQEFYDIFKLSGNQNCLSTKPANWGF